MSRMWQCLSYVLGRAGGRMDCGPIRRPSKRTLVACFVLSALNACPYASHPSYDTDPASSQL